MAKRKYGRPFSNKLAPAEAERLYLIAEECAEVVQVAMKVLRHGYSSVHPNGGPDNRALLVKELGDVATAVELMIKGGDIARKDVASYAQDKVDSLRKYAHFQPKLLLDRVQGQLDMWSAEVSPRERA